MDASRVHRIREDMERAEARRLQPHYIESFFLEAFARLGGTLKQREPRRYEVTHVPAPVREPRSTDRHRRADPPRYERIAFEKPLVAPRASRWRPSSRPGHPLLRATIDLTLERHRDLLRRGAVLVDERDPGISRASSSISSTRSRMAASPDLASGGSSRSGCSMSSSMPMARRATSQYAPYLDYRPLAAGEPGVDAILARPECAWIGARARASAHGTRSPRSCRSISPRSASAEARPHRQDRGGGQGATHQGDQLLGPPGRGAEARRSRPARSMRVSTPMRPASAPMRSRLASPSGWRSWRSSARSRRCRPSSLAGFWSCRPG